MLGPEEPLLFQIGFDQPDVFRRAVRELEVLQGLLIDGEKAHRGPVFRGHVGDRGAVGQRQIGHSRAVKFDEFPDHAFFPQHFGDGQDGIRRG